MIQLEHLSKTFTTSDRTVEAVNDINLTVNDGEIFGIIGLSGAGKSTLVRLINRLETPSGGKVIFDGKDIGSLNKKELAAVRKQMSMIFQGFNLLEQRSVLKNVCFPMELDPSFSKAEIKQRALELLNTVGLKDKAAAYPSQLSGGQKQRVAIARALATNPKVLLCDEATSALDPTTTQSILSLIKKINSQMGVTVIVITHEMKVIEQICDRVAVIDSGSIAESGDVKEVFMHPKTEIAKQLVMPKSETSEYISAKNCLRLVFDGSSSMEPIISQMTLECMACVNILFANTKILDGKTYGQMLIQMPDDETSQQKIKTYLDKTGVIYKEESANANQTND